MLKSVVFKIGPLVMHNGEYTDNETEMAAELNNYLASVFTMEYDSENQSVGPKYNDNVFLNIFDIHENEILLDK